MVVNRDAQRSEETPVLECITSITINIILTHKHFISSVEDNYYVYTSHNDRAKQSDNVAAAWLNLINSINLNYTNFVLVGIEEH